MLLVSVALVASVFSKPASPLPIKTEDDSVMEIIKVGDEHGHIVMTSDSVPIVYDNSYWCYMSKNASGEPVSSGVKAHAPSLRGKGERDFISSLNVKDIRETAFRNKIKRRIAEDEKGPGLMWNTFPCTGHQKALVILVQFSDVKFLLEDPREFFERELNGDDFTDYGATGSARKWFIENSDGKFLPQFDVYGPVTLPHPMAYYGANNAYGNDMRPTSMIIAACVSMDREIDFTQYDRDNDGVIDNVYVYYAGYGEADYADPNCVWPHSWNLVEAGMTSPELDGKVLNHYACSGELNGSTHCPDGIGTFVHEFSHVLGLPDLYNTTYQSSQGGTPFTPGPYSTLDIGPYNNLGRTPPNYSSYERYALGWMKPEKLTVSQNCILPPLVNSNKAYMITAQNENEYYLFENRQQIGNDEFIPGHGMIIWHIDYNQNVFRKNEVNNRASHQYVDLIEADGSQYERDRENDLFPGAARATSFSSSSRPKFSFWTGEAPPLSLHFINEIDGNITFRAVKSGDNPNVDPGSVASTETDAPFSIEGSLIIPRDGASVSIYNLTGLPVVDELRVPIRLSPGIYIVASGAYKAKIIIKTAP